MISGRNRITATKDWIKNNYPEILDKYSEFIVKPNEFGEYYDKFNYPFLDYDEFYFSVRHYGIGE